MFITATGVIKRSIDVYRANFGSLMRYVGLLFLFVIVAALILFVGIGGIFGTQLSRGTEVENLLGVLSGSLITFLVIWAIVLFVFSFWLNIAFMRTVSRAVLNQPKIGIGEELKNSRSLIGRSLGTTILVSLITMLPFVIGLFGWVSVHSMFLRGGSGIVFGASNVIATLLALYGFFHMFYFSIRFCFSNLAVIVDGCGIKEAMKKSSALVRGRWWGIFGRILLPVLALLVPYYLGAFLSQVQGFVGIFFALVTFVYYIFCLIPLAMIPSQVLYVSAKEFGVHPKAQ